MLNRRIRHGAPAPTGVGRFAVPFQAPRVPWCPPHGPGSSASLAATVGPLQPDLEVDPADPAVDVVGSRQRLLVERRRFILPVLVNVLNRRRGWSRLVPGSSVNFGSKAALDSPCRYSSGSTPAPPGATCEPPRAGPPKTIAPLHLLRPRPNPAEMRVGRSLSHCQVAVSGDDVRIDVRSTVRSIWRRHRS